MGLRLLSLYRYLGHFEGSNETFWNFMCIFVILMVLGIFQSFLSFQCILHVLGSILEIFEVLRIL